MKLGASGTPPPPHTHNNLGSSVGEEHTEKQRWLELEPEGFGQLHPLSMEFQKENEDSLPR